MSRIQKLIWIYPACLLGQYVLSCLIVGAFLLLFKPPPSPVSAVASLWHPEWRGKLFVPFSGAPFNGSISNPEGWVTWACERQGVKYADLKRGEQTALRARVGSPVALQVLRWAHRMGGGDPFSFLVTGLIYSFFIIALVGYLGRIRRWKRWKGFWDATATSSNAGATWTHWGFDANKDTGLVPYAWFLRQLDSLAKGSPERAYLPLRIARQAAECRERHRVNWEGEDSLAVRAAASEEFRERCDRLLAEDARDLDEFGYFTQSLPPLGFIGTVLGLGLAMQSAAGAQGIAEVTGVLATAFDCTFLSLVGVLLLEALVIYERRLGQDIRNETTRRIERFIWNDLRPQDGLLEGES